MNDFSTTSNSSGLLKANYDKESGNTETSQALENFRKKLADKKRLSEPPNYDQVVAGDGG